MKKLQNIKYILLACAFLFTATSCDKGFSELNVNPTQAADLNPAFQLTRIQLTMSNNRYEYWRAQYIYTSCIIQHNASLFSYWSGDKYNRIDSYSSALWDVTWTREVKNLVDLMTRTAEDPKKTNYTAAAKILWVYVMNRLTDLYGDMPYSEAGRGVTDGILFPKYDTQESIYTDMFAKLNEAIGGFSGSADPLDGDVMFAGDTEKWKRWANSLRLRLGMRLVKVNPTLAQEQVAAAISGGVMQGVDDSAIMTHTDTETNGNSDVMAADDNFRLSKTFVDYLLSTGDPRLPVWGMLYDDDGNANSNLADFKGMPNGLVSTDLQDGEHATFVRHNRSTIKSPSSPYFHQTYAEVSLLLAEAAVRGWGTTPKSAAEHFADGLQAGCDIVNMYPNAAIDAQAIADFIAANPLDESSTEASLEHINTEIWVSLYQNGMEAFANWRRSGYPDLVPVDHPIGTTNGTIPRRLYYPPSEAGINPSYQEAVNRQWGGENELTGRVWWDVQ